MAHQEIGRRLIERIVGDLVDIASVESPARPEGRTLTMVIMPKPLRGGKAEPRAASPDEGRPRVTKAG